MTEKTPEAAKAVAAPAEDPAGRDLDPRGILTNAEFRAAQAKARKKIDAERKRAAMDRAEAEEENRIRLEEGMLTGTVGDEMVDIRIELPDPDFNSCLLVNGQAFWHGQTYRVPRHVANSFREQMWRLQEHDALQIKGMKRKEFYRRQGTAMVNGRTGEARA